ncbi:MAG: group 1 glycosyl transferase [Parcubacteria group bacterium Gr01-1014_49]|nr:MAG: group 1 glycosyl transferase [Parcubacteria group bacterium Gr01-1014_49]
MKILFVSNDPSLFVAESASRARMRAYAAAIGELHILSSAPPNAKEEQEGSLFFHPINAWKLFRVRALAKRAHELILAHGIEIVSAQDPFEHGLAALRATRGTNAKLHVQVHTDFLSPWFVRSGNWRSPRVRMPFLNRWRRRVADRVLPAASGIRAVSMRIKDSLVQRYGSRIPEPSVIPITVSSEVPERVLLPAHPFTFALIAVGRLEPEKRIEDILAALRLVVAHYPMVGLFIVGTGSERGRLERMTRSLGLEEHVLFLGERADARALMASAQAFIQASAYEGYGRTLIEAALAKIPIITTDVGIVGEVFKGYEDVLAVPVADPTALSLSIVGFIEDVSVRQELPRRAEAAARAHLATVGDVPQRIADNLARTFAKDNQFNDHKPARS